MTSTASGPVGIADLPGDLPALVAAFGLAPVSQCSYLPDGWMNQNWRIRSGENFSQFDGEK